MNIKKQINFHELEMYYYKIRQDSLLNTDISRIIQNMGESEQFQRQIEMSDIIKNIIEVLEKIYNQNQTEEVKNQLKSELEVEKKK